MLIEEFENRTGFYPSYTLYRQIEAAYMASNLDKDAFCTAYKKNLDGIAEAIARDSSLADISADEKSKTDTAQKISALQKQVDSLTDQLELELDWKPHEMRQNVPQADYAALACGPKSAVISHFMTDEEATNWICDEYDFNPDKITILHEVPELEINRHGQLRETGKMIDRRPAYCATDYHYIRFNTSNFYYEVWNGDLRPFYA